jgi:aldose 1-epimerase
MPSHDATTIGNGILTADFLPQAGGRLARLRHHQFGDILQPMNDEIFDPLYWPKAGAYPLFPYHNLVADAAFSHQGHDYVLRPHPLTAPHAIHGPAHRRPWTIAGQGPDWISLTLDYRADEDWPFNFLATQHFQLLQDGLDVRLSITNTGKSPAPAGCGWHPYFAAGKVGQARSDARWVWPQDDNALPGAERQSRSGLPLPQEGPLTQHLSGWHYAEVDLACGLTARLEAGPQLNSLAFHRAGDYVCLEPVSHVAGALMRRKCSQPPLVTLLPAEGLEANITLSMLHTKS